jgi:hypothetical protein
MSGQRKWRANEVSIDLVCKDPLYLMQVPQSLNLFTTDSENLTIRWYFPLFCQRVGDRLPDVYLQITEFPAFTIRVKWPPKPDPVKRRPPLFVQRVFCAEPSELVLSGHIRTSGPRYNNYEKIQHQEFLYPIHG